MTSELGNLSRHDDDDGGGGGVKRETLLLAFLTLTKHTQHKYTMKMVTYYPFF